MTKSHRQRLVIYGTSQIEKIEQMLNGCENINVYNLNQIIRLPKPGRYIRIICKLFSADVYYSIFTGIYSPFNFSLFFISSLTGSFTICHWIGSDTIKALAKPKKTKLLQRFIDLNLTVAPHLSEELEAIGIKSRVVDMVLPGIDYTPVSMPPEHAVLAYLPAGEEEFYGLRYIDQAAEDFPGLAFFIVGNSNRNILAHRNNVTHLGKISMEEIDRLYSRISILVRMTNHDGLPMMVIEAMAKGRQVIYSHSFKNTFKAGNYEELYCHISEIIRTPPVLNQNASDFVKATYSVNKFRSELEAVFSNCKFCFICAGLQG